MNSDGGSPITEQTSSAAHRAARTDTLAVSVAILLAMTLAQRLIGFGRGILFCRWLTPAQLGEWDLAFAFLNLAAPLAVLGLPGSFGRYVEYYRQRGQFHKFLRRMALSCGLLGTIATLGVIACRDWFSWRIFGESREDYLVVWLALCLATVIVHNFLVSLFIAARMYRFVTVLQFIQSLGFAVVSLALMYCRPAAADCAVIGYMVATIVSCLGAAGWMKQLTTAEPADRPVAGQTDFWTRLAPFAIWMWVTNLLANLFDLIDRYMIVHYSGMPANEVLEVVGYYHSSRVVPLLFVGVAALLGSVITPHLSQDWELGRREAVVKRLNMMLKSLLLGLFAASIGVLMVAPWLFGVALADKFGEGLVVLPFTLAYCAWFGTLSVAQNYLWCVERAQLGSVGIFLGLAVNIALNLFLLPRFGLEGAVWATTAANLVALSAIYLLSQWHGMRIDLGTWIITLAPLSLGAGFWVASCVFVAIGIASLAGESLFHADEKRQLLDGLHHLLENVRSRIRRQPSLKSKALAPKAGT